MFRRKKKPHVESTALVPVNSALPAQRTRSAPTGLPIVYWPEGFWESLDRPLNQPALPPAQRPALPPAKDR